LTQTLPPTIRIAIMPTYEYVCAKCGHQFEKFQPISAKPLTICPEDLCARKRWGKGRVKRAIVTGGGLIFKGSGFYTTDYRSEKYKEAARKDVPATSSASTDSKPASSGESKPAPAAKPSGKATKAPAEKS
jgi:putative FmdB family regulatory protein